MVRIENAQDMMMPMLPADGGMQQIADCKESMIYFMITTTYIDKCTCTYL